MNLDSRYMFLQLIIFMYIDSEMKQNNNNFSTINGI